MVVIQKEADMNSSFAEIYEDGAKCRNNNGKESDNPYKVQQLREIWLKGFLDKDNEIYQNNMMENPCEYDYVPYRDLDG